LVEVSVLFSPLNSVGLGFVDGAPL
jgi:hypothetical protein